MYPETRPRKRSAIFVLAVVVLILTACGVSGINTNWPGLSTDGQDIYVSYGPGVLAYDGETQELLWSFPEEAGAGLSFYAAPSIDDGRVIIGDYGSSGSFSPQTNVSLYALKNAENGGKQELWTHEQLSQGSIIASPLQVGNRVFVGTADNSVFALRTEDGSPLWSEPFSTGHSVWGKPAYKDGLLFVNSLDKTVYAIDSESGTEIWRREFAGALASAPVVNLDLLYVAGFDHQVHALKIESGEEAWTATAEDWIWSAPAYNDGVVYFADAKGNTFAVDGATGSEIWSSGLGQAVQTSPVAVEALVFVGSGGVTEDSEQSGMLTALSAGDGEVVWQVDTPAPLYTTPVVVNDLIVVAMTSQGESPLLMAFDQQTGTREWEVFPPEGN